MKRKTCVAIRSTLILLITMMGLSSKSHAAQCCVANEGTIPLKTQIMASGLDSPWSMAFLPDGSLLIAERPGALRRLHKGKLSQPFKGLPEIEEIGQGGLLDLALDPDFNQTGHLFFSYAQRSKDGSQYGTNIGRARLNLAQNRLDNLRIIFSSNIKSSGGRHFGSRLRFGPDKSLYATLGDRGTQMRAQDPFDHAGSIIRINRDGSIPPDNPFADGKKALPEIWSIGHRNPQGAAIHPKTGALWTLSHGAAGGDEINQPKAGRNYGWPLISYGSNYSGRGFAKGSKASGLEQPIFYWDPSIAPSGFSFYSHKKPLIPAWNGSLLAGALRAQYLSRLIFKGDDIIKEERYLVSQFGRIRDVRTGPDGAVWLLTDSSNGQVIRLTQQ
ncbi:MAG: PQQ-dependent sugar dehydrogenase [Cohaesibacter sp.]|nr:PQQ-dependent sugar dehydrogenase [Cohaesibacter sp.]